MIWGYPMTQETVGRSSPFKSFLRKHVQKSTANHRREMEFSYVIGVPQSIPRPYTSGPSYTSYKYWTTPIYRMCNLIYNQLKLINDHNCSPWPCFVLKQPLLTWGCSAWLGFQSIPFVFVQLIQDGAPKRYVCWLLNPMNIIVTYSYYIINHSFNHSYLNWTRHLAGPHPVGIIPQLSHGSERGAGGAAFSPQWCFSRLVCGTGRVEFRQRVLRQMVNKGGN